MHGIVLAGGRSSRMGRDKALLHWQGRTLVERAVQALQARADRVRIVAGPGARYPVPAGMLLTDLWPGEGPLGGIVTGLGSAREQPAFVLACDMPLVTPSVLDLLASRLSRSVDVVAPRVGGLPQPLCALYGAAARPALAAAFEAGQRSPVRALRMLRVCYVDEPDLEAVGLTTRALSNVNSPEDLVMLESSAAGETPV